MNLLAIALSIVLSIFAILPIVLAIVIIKNPHSMMAMILSFIPPLTPTFMILRMAISTPPVWEIALSIILLLLFIFLSIKMAGEIFKAGALMVGKRPNLSEIRRWIKEN